MSTKITITLPPKLTRAVRIACKKYGLTYSDYFRQLARADTATAEEAMPQGFASMRKKDVVAAAKKGGRKKD